MPRESIEAPKVWAYDLVKTSIFLLGVMFLMAMMGAVSMSERLELGSWNIMAMIGMSFIFGWPVGMGRATALKPDRRSPARFPA